MEIKMKPLPIPRRKRTPPSPSESPACGRAWIELDRRALGANLDALRSLLPPGCQLMPAVKANAYGHGDILIARELNRLGVRFFCTACAREGAALRRAGIRGEILVLGRTSPAQFPLLTRFRLTQTVSDASCGEELNSYGRPVKVHIKVDTGMHRLGEDYRRPERIAALFNLPHLKITGIYTHLCTADGRGDEDRAFVLAQERAFRQVLSYLRGRGLSWGKAHLLASYGLLFFPQLGGDLARTGIALYGLLSRREDLSGCPVPLSPVLSLKARIALVRTLEAGEGAGYGLAYRAPSRRRIAVLTIGYADGLPRSLSQGRGYVLIGGRRAPIVGNICMDQTLVDVTEIPEAKAGDTAVLIGACGAGRLTAYDMAEASGTITNEILSRLGPRLERILL